MTETALEITDLALSYDNARVVEDFTLSIETGAFVSLLGPSGCGKTTVLRAIAGFLPVASGTIRLLGEDITRLPPERRDVGIVFQNYALFPTMTAFENIAFGLRAARKPHAEIRKAVAEIAEVAGIGAYLDRTPANLSGGQQQRVAIARALVMGTRVLLMDEPLSNLDAKVRQTMRREIKRLQREIGFTAVFVTHDQEEALSMSDSIVVLNAGRIEQIGTPRALYKSPATPFIAGFIGSANELSPMATQRLAGVIGARCFVKHEDLFFNEDGVPATVLHAEFLGTTTRIDLDLDGCEVAVLLSDATAPEIGATVHVALRPGAAHVFEGSAT
ncbi:MAG: putative spermidine/putrescine transport system ATP-binding protein [Rhodobacteraceae bacterium HLUCCA08]|nr:MAG: putative spermidine/putrescine transport system ATP-binding protein [Rhodobacteraceae bacterium HLUCCA08]